MLGWQAALTSRALVANLGGGWVTPQVHRALDAFVYGPILVYGGWSIPKERKWVRRGLIAIGLGTILLSGRAWLKNRPRRRR